MLGYWDSSLDHEQLPRTSFGDVVDHETVQAPLSHVMPARIRQMAANEDMMEAKGGGAPIGQQPTINLWDQQYDYVGAVSRSELAVAGHPLPPAHCPRNAWQGVPACSSQLAQRWSSNGAMGIMARERPLAERLQC